MNNFNCEKISFADLRITSTNDIEPINYEPGNNKTSKEMYPGSEDLLEKLNSNFNIKFKWKKSTFIEKVNTNGIDTPRKIQIRYRSADSPFYSPITELQNDEDVCVVVFGDERVYKCKVLSYGKLKEEKGTVVSSSNFSWHKEDLDIQHEDTVQLNETIIEKIKEIWKI